MPQVSKAQEYRVRAEECRRKAEGCSTAIEKEHWSKMAEEWLRMARDADRGGSQPRPQRRIADFFHVEGPQGP